MIITYNYFNLIVTRGEPKIITKTYTSWGQRIVTRSWEDDILGTYNYYMFADWFKIVMFLSFYNRMINLASTCKIAEIIGSKRMYSLISGLVSENSVSKGLKKSRQKNNKIPLKRVA